MCRLLPHPQLRMMQTDRRDWIRTDLQVIHLLLKEECIFKYDACIPIEYYKYPKQNMGNVCTLQFINRHLIKALAIEIKKHISSYSQFFSLL